VSSHETEPLSLGCLGIMLGGTWLLGGMSLGACVGGAILLGGLSALMAKDSTVNMDDPDEGTQAIGGVILLAFLIGWLLA
jgi:hypothetical protein